MVDDIMDWSEIDIPPTNRSIVVCYKRFPYISVCTCYSLYLKPLTVKSYKCHVVRIPAKAKL